MKGYVGTYTRTTSKGIYEIELDEVTGELQETGRMYQIENPTYLLHDGKWIYTIAEKDGNALVSMLTDSFEYLCGIESDGKGFCHLCIDDDKRYLIAASYRGGYFSVYSLDGGYLSERLYYVEMGENSHCHFVLFYGGYLLVVDLGLDKIFAYDFNFETGAIELNKNMTYSAQIGDGPRHIAVKGGMLYLLTELSAEIHVLEFKDGKLLCRQKISTLPNPVEDNTCAAIKITSNGRFLYASNRGHDSIAGYKVLSDGLLELVSFTPSGGKHPREIEIVPGDKFLLAANMDTNNIVTFEIDAESGELAQTKFELIIPQPVCLKF